MTWMWIYQDAKGEPVQNLDTHVNLDGFPTQADAENYIGQEWKQLLDLGVDGVTLYEDERLVYGPMSLHPDN